MLANDIKLTEIFSQDPETGFPLFGNQRMLITGLPAMGKLLTQLIDIAGREQLAGIFSRFGYQIGMGGALNLAQMYNFDSPLEWLKAARYMGNFSGLADSKIEIHQFDQEKKTLNFSAVCNASFEVDIWESIESIEKTQEPICHLTTGALSGFASVVFGSEVLVKEISCQVQGHSHCILEGKSASEWGLSSTQVRELWAQMEMNPLENEIELLQKKLNKTKKKLEKTRKKIQYLESQPASPGTDAGILYRSNHMNQLILLTNKVAPTKSTVLIQGESGTGKEVIARYIHKQSGREDHPFRAVNCAALPAKLLESELFGHKKGAFTGADTTHKGLLLESGKGSFFLDEIGELPLELQSKLLRVLQEKEVRPVGGVKPVPLEARIIAATNRDLKTLVKEKLFREDLYYRLAVFPLMIQPLRERKEDILLLSRHFLEKLHPGHPGFSPETVRRMESGSWPGNVRELENCIEYALILAGEKKIFPEHLPLSISSQDPMLEISSDLPTVKQMEKRYTRMVLANTNGNKSQAAKIMGISVTTLWRRLKEMGVEK